MKSKSGWLSRAQTHLAVRGQHLAKVHEALHARHALARISLARERRGEVEVDRRRAPRERRTLAPACPCRGPPRRWAGRSRRRAAPRTPRRRARSPWQRRARRARAVPPQRAKPPLPHPRSSRTSVKGCGTKGRAGRAPSGPRHAIAALDCARGAPRAQSSWAAAREGRGAWGGTPFLATAARRGWRRRRGGTRAGSRRPRAARRPSLPRRRGVLSSALANSALPERSSSTHLMSADTLSAAFTSRRR